jgi:N-acetylmuramoyl-L-alanine amidase
VTRCGSRQGWLALGVLGLLLALLPAGSAVATPGQPLATSPTWHPKGRHHAAKPWRAAWPKPAVFAATGHGPLTGRRILLDPGHNLGNSSHTRQIAASSWPHLRKGCNTTGTATNAGYPEATYAFTVVTRLRKLLVRQGATVIVTRDRNTRDTWGPCVQARGELGRQVGADLLLSVHADGGPGSGHGFHVIAPAYAKGWTDDIAVPSKRLARKVVKGMVARGMDRSTYLSSTIQVRSDQETLRNSDVPAVIVETLNMRNAGDARIASTKAGRHRVAAGLLSGLRRYLRS